MFSLRQKEPLTLRRALILALLPTAVKLTIWALLRKAVRDSLEKDRSVENTRARAMKEEGYSNDEIANSLGIKGTAQFRDFAVRVHLA